MAKKTTTISIDENLLRLAKKEIPNFSQFVSNCLETYLGLNDSMVNNIQVNLDTIKQAQLEIHLLSRQNEENEYKASLSRNQTNKYWLKIWSIARNGEQVPDNIVYEVADKLNITTKYLMMLVDDLLTYSSPSELVECNDYDYAVKTHEKMLNE